MIRCGSAFDKSSRAVNVDKRKESKGVSFGEGWDFAVVRASNSDRGA